MEKPKVERRIVRLRAVRDRTGLSRSTLYKLEGQGQFPHRVSLGERSVGWYEDEISAWVESRQRRQS